MQVTIWYCYKPNMDGLLKAQIGALSVCKNKSVHLGVGFLALLMQAAICRWGQVKDGFKGLIKAPLFLISAVKRDRLYGIIGLQQALRRAFNTLTYNVRMYSGLNQLVKACLEFFPIDSELPAKIRDRVLLIKIVVKVVPDLPDQECIFSLHNWKRLTY
jgi:hypothetical protein